MTDIISQTDAPGLLDLGFPAGAQFNYSNISHHVDSIRFNSNFVSSQPMILFWSIKKINKLFRQMYRHG